MTKTAQKYTLSLPPALYQELSEEAARQERSIREIVVSCLKIGLIAIKVNEDPNTELFIREKVEIPNSGKPPKYNTRETLVKLV